MTTFPAKVDYTTGNVLTAAQMVDIGNLLNSHNPTGKGSLFASSGAGVPVELVIGADGLFLIADSTTAMGLRWATSTAAMLTSSCTPVVSASSGTITTATATGAYYRIGPLIFFSFVATITTNGTGAGQLRITLPITANSRTANGAVREQSATGVLNQCFTSGAQLIIITTSNAYPAADGYAFEGSIVYEAA